MISWFKRLAAPVAAMALWVAAPSAVSAATVYTYTFNNVTHNKGADVATGEAQLSFEVSSVNSTQVMFQFFNVGPNASSITDVYFDDGQSDDNLETFILADIASISNTSGVQFQEGANPGNLPGGKEYSFTSDFDADSTSPTQPNGVNPGETLSIIFNLNSTFDFQDVIRQLDNGANNPYVVPALRVGIHVQGFALGGSESFINDGPGKGVPVPLPGVAWAGMMLLGSLGGARALKRLRGKAVAA